MHDMLTVLMMIWQNSMIIVTVHTRHILNRQKVVNKLERKTNGNYWYMSHWCLTFTFVFSIYQNRQIDTKEFGREYRV